MTNGGNRAAVAPPGRVAETDLAAHAAAVTPHETAADAPAAIMETSMDRDSDRQADPVGGRAETRKLIETKIDMLPDALRTVFMLCAVQGLTIEDTAAALNIAAATVRTRFMRARELMRDGLSPDMNPAYGEVFAFAGERCDRFVERVMESIDGGRNSRVK